MQYFCTTHCNALQRTATHCNALQCTATQCNTLQYTAIHCITLYLIAPHYTILQRTASRCNTLQHTATVPLSNHSCAFSQKGRIISKGGGPVAVCCSVLQRVAACCSVLQCVLMCGSAFSQKARIISKGGGAEVCFSVLRCVVVRRSVLWCVAVCCSVLQRVSVCFSVLQCVAVCCSVLQCVAVIIEGGELDTVMQFMHVYTYMHAYIFSTRISRETKKTVIIKGRYSTRSYMYIYICAYKSFVFEYFSRGRQRDRDHRRWTTQHSHAIYVYIIHVYILYVYIIHNTWSKDASNDIHLQQLSFEIGARTLQMTYLCIYYT